MLDSYRGSSSPQLNASRDYARQRQMGIGDLLLENRIVFLDGPIHDASANLTANLLQSQRDFFGAHTFERIDKPRGEFFHFDWLHS